MQTLHKSQFLLIGLIFDSRQLVYFKLAFLTGWHAVEYSLRFYSTKKYYLLYGYYFSILLNLQFIRFFLIFVGHFEQVPVIDTVVNEFLAMH